MKHDDIYHLKSWISQNEKLPVKSVPAAEILAATEGIDEGKMMDLEYSEILKM